MLRLFFVIPFYTLFFCSGEIVSEPVPCGANDEVCEAGTVCLLKDWEGPNAGKYVPNKNPVTRTQI